jgi:hypothetical protein
LKTCKSTGYWWLPDNPLKKIHGNLDYKYDNYATLSLEGIFDDNCEYHQLILGQVDDCRITLLNCVRSNLIRTRSGTGDFVKSTFQVVVILKGHHLEKIDDIRFSSIEVSYSHLTEWIGHLLIDYPNIENREKETILTIKEPKSIEIRLPDLTIEIKGSYKNQWGTFKQIAEQFVVVRFYSHNMDFLKMLNKVQDLKNFLELLTGEEIEMNRIMVGEFSSRYEVIIPTILKETNTKSRFKFCPVPIEANVIIPKIEFYCNNWFSFIQKYEPVFELYFGELYKKTYVTNRFLNYCQAIEAYFSRNEKFDDRFFKSDFDKVLEKFMAIVESSNLRLFKDVIRTKLSFLTRKTLRMIIEELVKENEAVSVFIKDNGNFADKVVKTRNHFTHYNSENKPKVIELFRLTEDMRFLLIAIMLKEIGFEQSLIKSAVARYCCDRVRGIFGINGISQD